MFALTPLGHPTHGNSRVAYLPSGSRLMANMVQAEVMKHHETPIIVFQFFWDVSSYVIVYFGEVLRIWLADASYQ